MNKIVTYHGDVETTSFFMTQIEGQLKRDGFEIYPFYYDKIICRDNHFFYDSNPIVEKVEEILQGEKTGNTVFLTFNFAGLYGSDVFWAGKDQMGVDYFQMRCVNIIVDHPYHYHDFMKEQIAKRADRYMQICIDRVHIDYMKRYFPQTQLGPFFPSAGTGKWMLQRDGFLKNNRKKYLDQNGEQTDYSEKNEELWVKLYEEYDKRPYDIVFAGTYVSPESFQVFIDRNGEEYSRFYHSIIDECYANPKLRLEDVARRRIVEEIQGVTEEEIRETLGHMQFLDYYIRFMRRGDVVRTLADAGFQILVCDTGWKKLKCSHPENITAMEYMSSIGCLRLLEQAKLSLNVLPCFHEGAHDRIFNSMLCGAVCVTDSNAYLDNYLKDDSNAIVYQMDNLNKLTEHIRELLDGHQNNKLIEISKNGFSMAMNGQTWYARTKILEQIL